MGIILEERPSDSHYVERIWRSRSEGIDTFTSIAVFQWDFVVWKHQGKTHVTLQGPETKASAAPVPDEGEFFGILFKPGVFMPHLPVARFVNGDIELPRASGQSFWLNNEIWHLPTYENADTFVDCLIRTGVLGIESVVDDVMQGHTPDMSLRSVQRRFMHTAGLNYRTIQQIERARRAAILLRQGVSILDTVYETGYFDQAYLTKSLKHFIGKTPLQLMNQHQPEQLSLLYKTESFT